MYIIYIYEIISVYIYIILSMMQLDATNSMHSKDATFYVSLGGPCLNAIHHHLSLLEQNSNGIHIVYV